MINENCYKLFDIFENLSSTAAKLICQVGHEWMVMVSKMNDFCVIICIMVKYLT